MRRLSGQLAVALHEAENGMKISLSDEELVRIATKVASADPKKRFGVSGLRTALAAENGVEWVAATAQGGASLDKRVRELATGKGPFIPDRAGMFRLAKRATGTGVEFVKQGPDEYEILVNGEYAGRLAQDYAETGLYRSRAKVWEVELDDPDSRFTGKDAPPTFKSLADAKKWVMAKVPGGAAS